MFKIKKEWLPRLIWTACTAAWFIFMLYLSHENPTDSGKVSVSVADKVVGGTVDTSGMHWQEREALYGGVRNFIRGTAHVFVFSVLAVLVYFTVRAWKLNPLLGVGFLLVWAVSDELLKLLTAGRHCDAEDILKNVVGAAIGVLVAQLTVYSINKKRSKNGKNQGTEV